MVIKPKTIKDLQANTRVLNALNKNHKDDIFSSNKTKKKEVPKVKYKICLFENYLCKTTNRQLSKIGLIFSTLSSFS